MDLDLSLELLGNASTEFVVKLPSPMVKREAQPKLIALDYSHAKERTLAFWSGWVARGARFQVPEEAVNDLFRANIWHALRLPRRHGSGEGGLKIDLPYSNFAYG